MAKSNQSGDHLELHMVATGHTKRGMKKWTKITSDILIAPIVCTCGHETSREKCKSETGENEFYSSTNYYCDSCGEWIRTDSKLHPLPEKVSKKMKKEASEDE